jgi:hypothetical protein
MHRIARVRTFTERFRDLVSFVLASQTRLSRALQVSGGPVRVVCDAMAVTDEHRFIHARVHTNLAAATGSMTSSSVYDGGHA